MLHYNKQSTESLNKYAIKEAIFHIQYIGKTSLHSMYNKCLLPYGRQPTACQFAVQMDYDLLFLLSHVTDNTDVIISCPTV